MKTELTETVAKTKCIYSNSFFLQELQTLVSTSTNRRSLPDTYLFKRTGSDCPFQSHKQQKDQMLFFMNLLAKFLSTGAIFIESAATQIFLKHYNTAPSHPYQVIVPLEAYTDGVFTPGHRLGYIRYTEVPLRKTG